MDTETTFAYMVFSCSWNTDLAAEFDDWYWGDFVECSMETEDQAEEPSAVWAYDLDYEMSRIAPVQLTLGWDPRPTLVQVFEHVGIQPLFRGTYRHETNWLAFPVPHEPLQWQNFAQENIPKPRDFHRFQEVVDATIELAREQNRSVLFVGGSGFSYDIDAVHLTDAAPVLKQAGMKFFDRHGQP